MPGTVASRKLLSPTGLGRNLLIVVMIESGRGEISLAQKRSLRTLAGIHLPKKILEFQITYVQVYIVIKKVVGR